MAVNLGNECQDLKIQSILSILKESNLAAIPIDKTNIVKLMFEEIREQMNKHIQTTASKITRHHLLDLETRA